MFNNIKDFYPTPDSLIREMLNRIDFKMISSVLEPSAGDGRLVEAVINKMKCAHNSYYNKDKKWDIDTIEIEQNLRHVLTGKGHRVVHDDFLTYNSLKHYDLIVANFPFSEGDKHLLKALEMQKRGGQLVCLVNAETIKNPYSNIRKDLLRQLEEHNAEIKYIPDAFIDSERKTYVEVALIYVNIEKPQQSSIILEELRQEESFREESHNSNSVVNGDFLKGIVEQYNFEVKAGLKLIAEYNSIKPLILSSFKDDYSKSPILELKLNNKDDNSTLENGYIKQVRMKYWSTLFTSDQFMGLFTSNLRHEYYNKVNELKDYDFSLYNIYTIKIQLNNEMVKAVEKTILDLFDQFSHQSAWDKEFSRNIHYYSGWQRNSCWKVNSRIIQRLSAYDDWSGRFNPTNYKVVEKLEDIEKTFAYLDSGDTPHIDLREALKFAEGYGDTKKIDTKFMILDFFKKGTVHITFKYPELVDKFNIFAARSKMWLPPSYGKKHYNEMSKEEKKVVDEFQGKDDYNKVMANKDYYLVETSKLLMLA